ncbi:hypothetical protein HYFRA_00013381 [Hymenoscyphus fraxineus]|uniref:Uncharacterized protein n=1 Tax=Hymenoscyphus fraxineus TaxID=746836 RepID=A0A9N9L9L9_9HELO|nr:hypothetical protein HYFRA_00013381 [Hymenoscyphus fraxineus]
MLTDVRNPAEDVRPESPEILVVQMLLVSWSDWSDWRLEKSIEVKSYDKVASTRLRVTLLKKAGNPWRFAREYRSKENLWCMSFGFTVSIFPEGRESS